MSILWTTGAARCARCSNRFPGAFALYDCQACGEPGHQGWLGTHHPATARGGSESLFGGGLARDQRRDLPRAPIEAHMAGTVRALQDATHFRPLNDGKGPLMRALPG